MDHRQRTSPHTCPAQMDTQSRRNGVKQICVALREVDQKQVEEFKTRFKIPQGSDTPLPCRPHRDRCPVLGAGGAEEEEE